MKTREGCVRVDHLDKSLSVSLPSCNRVTGQVLGRIKLRFKLEVLITEKGEERGHCSLLLNQKRASSFFCLHDVMSATQVKGVKEARCLPN